MLKSKVTRFDSILLSTAAAILVFGCNSGGGSGGGGGGGGGGGSAAAPANVVSSGPLGLVPLSGVTGNTFNSVWGGARAAITLKADGTVWTWGSNDDGQLGNGNTTNQALPGQVAGLSGITAIMGAEHNNIALKNDGTVWTWGGNDPHGNNSYYLLGAGPSYDNDLISTSPVQVAGLTSVTLLGSRAYHAVAVKADGTVWSWGWNFNGSLGDGTNDIPSAPVEVQGVSSPIQVTAGFGFSVALLPNHTLVTWGSDASEALGNEAQYDNGALLNASSPVAVATSTGLTDVVRVSAGWEHVLALKSDGTVWAWGTNTWDGACGTSGSHGTSPASGRLGIVDGNGNPVTDESLPTQVPGLTNVVQVSGGDGFSAVLKSDGTVWTFGANGCGQLGNGDANLLPQYTPVQVVGLTNVVWITARDHHAQAIKADGTMWAWGSGEQGELGVSCNPIASQANPGPGDCTNSNVPVQVQFN